MTEMFSLEFWVGIQFLVDLVMVGLIIGLVRRLKSDRKAMMPLSGDDRRELPRPSGQQEIQAGAGEIMDMLEPLVREAEQAASAFERQIVEKRHLIRSLNRDLDTKIISINLLLSRAERLLQDRDSLPGITGYSGKKPDIMDQQASILELCEAGLDEGAIASRLSIPRGEVQLVISLKKKFTAMENSA